MLNVSLWALQFLLAVVFLAHGWMFLWPPASMVQQLNASIGPGMRVFIGVAEVLAAAGLTLPGLTRRLPGLVPTAAGGLAVLMINATIFHLARGETSSAAVTAVLLALTSSVTYMRWKVMPIPPRTVA
ncbi:MAG TPA: DoxX family protein [Vicinamibacterales bacterium]|nr:DoxX family protein [Vicinamibacterales bacterium]